MNNNNENVNYNDGNGVSHHLDITAHTCPMTFVRTKLMIEKMAPGEVAEVRLKGSEPLANVPRSVRDMGHTVLGLEAEKSAPAEAGVFRLLIRKN